MINSASAQSKTADTAGSWSNTATWQGGVVPAAGDTIYINSGIGVTFDAGADDALTYGNLILKGHNSQLIVSSGGVGSTGLKLGNIEVDSTLGYFSVSTGITLYADTVFMNGDTLVIDGLGTLSNSGPVVIDQGGVFKFNGDITVAKAEYSGTGGTIDVNAVWPTIDTLLVLANGSLTFGTGTLSTDTLYIGPGDTLTLTDAASINNTSPITIDSAGALHTFSGNVDDIIFAGALAHIYMTNNLNMGKLILFADGSLRSNEFTLNCDSILINNHTLSVDTISYIQNSGPVMIGTGGRLKLDAAGSGSAIRTIVFADSGGTIDIDGGGFGLGDPYKLILQDDAFFELAAGTWIEIDVSYFTNEGSTGPVTATFTGTGSVMFNSEGYITLYNDLIFDMAASNFNFTNLDSLIAKTDAVFDPGMNASFPGLQAIGGDGAGTTLILKSDLLRKYTISSPATTTGDLELAGGDTLLLSSSPALTLGAGHTFTLSDSSSFDASLVGSFVDSAGTFVNNSTGLVTLEPPGAATTTASGSWSNTATWQGGVLPEEGDTVYINNTNLQFDASALDVKYGPIVFLGSSCELMILTNGTGATGLKAEHLRIDSTYGYVGDMSAGVVFTVDSITVNSGQNLGFFMLGGSINHGPVTISGTLTCDGTWDSVTFKDGGKLFLDGQTADLGNITITGGGVFQFTDPVDTLTANNITITSDTLQFITPGTINNGSPVSFGANTGLITGGNVYMRNIALAGDANFTLGADTLFADSIIVNNHVLQTDLGGTIVNSSPVFIGAAPGALMLGAVSVGDIEFTGAGALLSVDTNVTMSGALKFIESAAVNIAAGYTLNMSGQVFSNEGAAAEDTVTFTGSGTMDFNGGSIKLYQDMIINAGGVTFDYSTLDTLLALSSAVFDPGLSPVFSGITGIGGDGPGVTLTLKSDSLWKYTISSPATTTGDLELAGGDTLLLSSSPALTLGAGHTFTLSDTSGFIDTLAGSFVPGAGFFVDARTNLAPQISISPDTLYFAETDTSQVDSLYLWVYNIGSDTLDVDSVSVQIISRFAIAPDSATGIAPGDSVQFTVYFDPDSAILYSDSLLFYSNDSLSSPLAIYAVGAGRSDPMLIFENDSLFFADTDTSLVDSLYLWVYNAGGDTLDIDSVLVASDSVFTISPDSATGIAAGDSIQFLVYFNPDSAKSYTDSLLFYSNDTLAAPKALYVQGIGTVPMPNLALVDSLAWFGAVLVDTTRDVAMVTIQNTGGDSAEVSSVAPTGPFTVVSPGFPQMVYADSSVTFTVQFVPPGEGTFNGSLDFTTTDPAHPSLVFYLSGLGTKPNAGYLTYQDIVNGLGYMVTPTDMAVSPDGKNLYVSSSSPTGTVVVFSRNDTTGATTYMEAHQDGSDLGGGMVDGILTAQSVEVSPDGKHVLVTGLNGAAIAVFNRNTSTGSLTFNTHYTDTDIGGTGLTGAYDIAFSPDGKHVYVTGRDDDAVTLFSRNSADGTVTFIEALTNTDIGGVGIWESKGVAVSADGKNVYVTGSADDAVTVFGRNPVSGKLTFVEYEQDVPGGSAEGLDGAISVTVSADGNHVYAAGKIDNAIVVFDRSPADGSLTLVETLVDAGVDGSGNTIDGLASSSGVRISPDGFTVYVAGLDDKGVPVFRRDPADGRLTFIQVPIDALDDGFGNTVDGLNYPQRLTVSPDGKNVYAGSQGSEFAIFSVNALSNISLSPDSLNFD
ncbi:beta-propeller fold lactonase family protein, partial [candidate division KSB1 bacterium]